MAILSLGPSNNLTFSLKVVLISTAILSIAVMLKLSMPVVTEFAVSEVPSIWSIVVSWLRPPYLYLVINCIIITIIASSKLQSKVDESSPVVSIPTEPIKIPEDVAAVYGGGLKQDGSVVPDSGEYGYDSKVVMSGLDFDVFENVDARASETEPAVTVKALDDESDGGFKHDGAVVPDVAEYGYDSKVVSGLDFDVFENVDARASETEPAVTVKALDDELIGGGGGDEFVVSKSSWKALRNDPTEFVIPSERTPFSARFGHRKVVNSSPEGGRTLGVSKTKRQDTLESTWKTITDGRPMPLNRHLRKSDTWETHGHHHHVPQEPHHKMNKSETFNDCTTKNNNNNNNSSPLPRMGSGKLKKDPSLGQDELNRRVEAFIKKFNEDMRLQRQESLNQYIEMINRGHH